MTPARISRRHAVSLIGLGVASIATGAAGWALGVGEPSARLRPSDTGQALRQPELLSSKDGELAVTLTAAPGVRIAGRNTFAYGFNSTSPGPTLRVRPGDLLRVRLDNRLDRTTNLHTHGLHVSPQGNADNPFVSIAPGTGFDYAIQIPAGHPTGTFWYHPHHHGSVAEQIFGGLVGALLVEGDQPLSVTADQILMITDITLDEGGRVVAATPMDTMMGREGALVLVNGQHQPVITASGGTIQRWRIINACVSRVLVLRLQGHQLTQIALDGIYLPQPVDHEQITLAPGNRVDVLIRAAASGRYEVIAEPYSRGAPAMMSGADPVRRPVVLATFAVTGPLSMAAALPPLPAAPPVPRGRVTGQRRLALATSMGMGSTGFTIDGRPFDPERDDQTVMLGATEDWTIVNTSPMDHPFHLHAWPFHVLSDNTGRQAIATLQDVVLVPANGSVRVRIPFTDYAGRSVYHCHILDHEDLGMMGTVNVRG